MSADMPQFLQANETVDGVSLHYRLGGPEGGRPVILWHGFLSTGTVWRKVAPDLARAGYRVLIPDMRGEVFAHGNLGEHVPRHHLFANAVSILAPVCQQDARLAATQYETSPDRAKKLGLQIPLPAHSCLRFRFRPRSKAGHFLTRLRPNPNSFFHPGTVDSDQ
jgi:alpha-beta hydrolase superfamily lysophospholipase